MSPKKERQLGSHVSGQANRPLSRPAHALPYTKVVEETKGDLKDGLADAEAERRLEECGRNELGDASGPEPFKIFVGQVVNTMTLVLILAMVVSFAIESWVEGGVVCAVIALNIIVGFVQEFQAEKTMDSLRALSSPTANAIRHGKNVTVPTSNIVPGDMVEMKTGDTIPADVRLIEAVNFETDEALLTGESLPVRKDADSTFEDETGPGDRLNIAYSSSTVTRGRARGVVFATGLYTEIGSIAAALRKKDSKFRSVKRKPDGKAKSYRYVEALALTGSDAVGRFLGVSIGTPLQKKLSRLAVLLFWIAVVCAIIVLGANSFSHKQEVIIYAIATGLSMIPASLPVVLTIAMAAGTKRMVERHVIVRNLKSLEALGGVTDICSDKTGTLTQGRMAVKKAWVPARGTYTIGESNEPFNPNIGDLEFHSTNPKDMNDCHEKSSSVSYSEAVQDSQCLREYLNVASLANLAKVHCTDGQWTAQGDPTEIAIQVFASRFDWNRQTLTRADDPMWRPITEFPFDSDVKKMSVLLKEVSTSQVWVFTKGSVERIIHACTSIDLDETGSTPMTEEISESILANMEELASRGLRVLAFASKKHSEVVNDKEQLNRAEFETDLTFRGLIGLYDPPRPESAESVRQCHEAGISVHMLTGDHPGTARAIALEVGILSSRMGEISKDVADALVMTANAFDKLSDDEIDALPVLPLVVARCAPSTKVRMIEALHRRGKFAAMTGDGVNDSPSLKRSDVGVAMGTGSDVAKDASDIVLTDDNFASIVHAIEEGRRMFDNIQKFILHLLAENIAQACVLLIGLAFKDSDNTSVFPLAPVEVLWVIMITSGMPDMGLGFEVAAPDILQRPPQSLKTGVFTPEILLDMLIYGLWTAALCLSTFLLVLYGFSRSSSDSRTSVLGTNCNESYTAQCDTVFRARATCFACLTWFALFLAWEMKDMRRSLFQFHSISSDNAVTTTTTTTRKPSTAAAAAIIFKRWAYHLYNSNKFLSISILVGFITVFPTLYIPVINHKVFKHQGISWEWAIVFISTALFIAGIEAWKWTKRVWYRRSKDDAGRRKSAEVGDLDDRPFGRYYDSSSLKAGVV